MSLVLTPFARAVERLAEGIERQAREPDDEQLRDGLIQRFEFTYDLAHKMLRRALLADRAVIDDIDQMSFGAMIRMAWARGYTAHEWAEWRSWRDLRNITSHTYDQEKARAAAVAIPAFLIVARDALSRLGAAQE